MATAKGAGLRRIAFDLVGLFPRAIAALAEPGIAQGAPLEGGKVGGDEVGVLVVEVKAGAKRGGINFRRDSSLSLEHLNGVEALIHYGEDALECEPERRDGALEALEQVGRHELADTRLATACGEISVPVLVLAPNRRQQIVRRDVDRKLEQVKRVCNLAVRSAVGQR